jgi:isoleucyl-tRNA synthetase
VGATQQPIAPFKQLVTHGFVLDADGRKMSKSLGNVISPGEYISGKKTKYGVDVVRLWVSASGYTGDVVVGPTQINQASEDLIKLRGTLRYLLGVVGDFDPKLHTAEAFAHRSDVEMDADAGIQLIDRWTLARMQRFHFRLSNAYEEHNFRGVYSELMRFVTSDVSAMFITTTKDRLRCEPQDSKTRRAAQAVAWKLLQSLTLGMAPIAPHMAEDVYSYACKEVGPFDVMFDGESVKPTWVRDGEVKHTDENPFSVFQYRWLDADNLPDAWQLSPREKNLCQDLQIIRDRLHLNVAGTRSIKSQERASVTLYFEGESKLHLECERLSIVPDGGMPFMSPLASFLGVPEVKVVMTLVPEQGNDVLKVKSAYSNDRVLRMVVDPRQMRDAHKCKRCWMHVHEEHMRGDVCGRCESQM